MLQPLPHRFGHGDLNKGLDFEVIDQLEPSGHGLQGWVGRALVRLGNDMPQDVEAAFFEVVDEVDQGARRTGAVD